MAKRKLSKGRATKHKKGRKKTAKKAVKRLGAKTAKRQVKAVRKKARKQRTTASKPRTRKKKQVSVREPQVETEIVDVIDEPVPGIVRVTEFETTRLIAPGAADDDED